MIISQTPLRLSFFGGGTDLQQFYGTHGGAVFSTAIDRFVYVVVKRRFDNMIRVSYSLTEMVHEVDEIKHDLVREAMRITGVGPGVEIVTLADVPSEGTGLGSSSSLTVGLLNALFSYQGEVRGAHELAELACDIEIKRLGRPIGKQDQFIAAYGGLRHIRFEPDQSTVCETPAIPSEYLRALRNRLLAFFTGGSRSSSSILEEQRARTAEHTDILKAMRQQSFDAVELLRQGQLDEFGRMLDETWCLKRKLASNITNPLVEEMYDTALQAGALGGKIAGAGGSGFMLLYVPPEHQDSVRTAFASKTELPIHLEARGSRITFHTER